MSLYTCFMDLHIHIGRTRLGQPVKITASKSLTLPAIVHDAALRKGIQVLGIIDGACLTVREDLEDLIDAGDLLPRIGGGYLYQNQVLLLAGYEIEIKGPAGGVAHFGCWLPDLQKLREFGKWLSTVVKNPALSSQMARCTAREVQQVVQDLDGMFVVNHAFTPHTGMYGACVSRAEEMIDLSKATALELGLSADQQMADQLSELKEITFITNSDAHSIAKIGREYNKVALDELSFDGVKRCLLRTGEGRVLANYGLSPALGKYHATYCPVCNALVDEETNTCVKCGSKRIVRGVSNRIAALADQPSSAPPHRPPYLLQVPLEFYPGVGPKTIQTLLDHFGTEMNVLHEATEEALQSVVSPDIAQAIVEARSGKLELATGGGGRYGKVLNKNRNR